MTNDKEVYGAGLAKNIELAAKEQGLEIIANEAIDKNAANYRSLAQKAKARRRGLLRLLGHHRQQRGPALQGLRGGAAGREALRAGRRREAGFADPKEGGIPADVARASSSARSRRCRRTSTRRRARSSSRQFTEKYGEDNPDPYAIYGYEAMRLALDAIERSGTGEKEDILKALFETKDRASVLGTYSIDENGDTTLTDYGVYTIKDGELTFDQTIKAQAG